jgi:hypothetical protein
MEHFAYVHNRNHFSLHVNQTAQAVISLGDGIQLHSPDYFFNGGNHYGILLLVNAKNTVLGFGFHSVHTSVLLTGTFISIQHFPNDLGNVPILIHKEELTFYFPIHFNPSWW